MGRNDYLNNLKYYYETKAPAQMARLKHSDYLYLPWWRLAVRLESKAGWDFIASLQSAPNKARLLTKKILTLVVRLFKLKMFGVRTLPNVEGAEWDIIFYGRGRHKVTLFRFKDSELLCLSRGDASNEFLKREIYVRTQGSQFLTVPELKSSDPEGRFYQEAFIQGKTLEKLHSDKAQAVSVKIFEQLWKFYVHEGLKSIPVEEYLGSLLKEIASGKQRIVLFPEELKELTLKVSEKYKEEELCIVKAHGDLHFENVMTLEGKYYLMDWEFLGERSLYFDWFNYRYLAIKTYRQDQEDVYFGRVSPNKEQAQLHPDFLGKLQKLPALYRYIFLLERIVFELGYEAPEATWVDGWFRELKKMGEVAL